MLRWRGSSSYKESDAVLYGFLGRTIVFTLRTLFCEPSLYRLTTTLPGIRMENGAEVFSTREDGIAAAESKLRYWMLMAKLRFATDDEIREAQRETGRRSYRAKRNKSVDDTQDGDAPIWQDANGRGTPDS